MGINIKNEEAEALARLVAREANEGLTEAITQALRERLARLRARRAAEPRTDRILEIAQQCASLPDLDPRTPEEILGYDDKGLP